MLAKPVAVFRLAIATLNHDWFAILAIDITFQLSELQYPEATLMRFVQSRRLSPQR